MSCAPGKKFFELFWIDERQAEIRRAGAPCEPPALGLSSGNRRDVEELGRAEGAFARSRSEASGGAGSRPRTLVHDVYRRAARRNLRRGARLPLGHRRVRAGGRPRRGVAKRCAAFPARRRAAAGRVAALQDGGATAGGKAAVALAEN